MSSTSWSSVSPASSGSITIRLLRGLMLACCWLGLRDVSERYVLTHACREIVRRWVHRLGMVFSPMREPGRI
ncbi:MAG: hypothetical protein QXS68_04965 [Candidatus Methanomethylicaceae archaeon]